MRHTIFWEDSFCLQVPANSPLISKIKEQERIALGDPRFSTKKQYAQFEKAFEQAFLKLLAGEESSKSFLANCGDEPLYFTIRLSIASPSENYGKKHE